MNIRKKYREETYEFAVIGGGLSGLCAALAASRHGVKTVLVQARPVLGGNASSEIRVHICGADENSYKPELTEGGILHEILLENKAVNDYFNYSYWDAILYQTAKNEPNLTVYYNTSMTECDVENGKIKSVLCFQTTTEYTVKISADYFADCTGNGTLGYFAGAEYREGSEASSEFGESFAPEKRNGDRMGNTILFKAIKRDVPVKFTPPPFAKKLTEEQLKFRIHSKFHTVDASSAKDPDAFIRASTGSTTAVDYGYWWIELMGDGDDFISQYEKVNDELYSYVWGMWDHIKNGGNHGAEFYDLDWIGTMAGMRESRRLIGDYVLCQNDITENRIFEDAVAYGGWPMDVHCKNGLLDFDKLPSEVYSFTGAYTIPWRCYYSANVSNLMMAGRDISTTRVALGSTRVMGTCAVGGQAVGTAAALLKKYGLSPRELSSHIGELRQTILKDDGFIPGCVNADGLDIARKAKVSASSHKENYLPENVINGVSRAYEGNTNQWRSDGISSNGELLAFDLAERSAVGSVQITFDSGFEYPIKITLSDNRRKIQRIGVPPELVKDFEIRLVRDNETVLKKKIVSNHQRLVRTDFEKTECDRVEVRFESTNGTNDVRVFEVRIY